MGLLSCPFRGDVIPRLFAGESGTTNVCLHPAVRGPCSIGYPKRPGIRPCAACQFWREPPSAPIEPLDPAQFSPPEIEQPLVQLRSGPCAHLGAPTGNMVPCLTCGGTQLKVFSCSIHGQCTIAKPGEGIAAQCSDCPDYVSAPAAPRAEWVLVPQPPPLDLSPQHRRAVVTVAVGQEGRALLAASGASMRDYAERIGADFVVLDWPGHPRWPMSAKFAIPRVLDHYERIIYTDADVLFRAGCVNLFDLCGEDEFGGVDELPHTRLVPQYGQERRYQAFRRAMGFRPLLHLPWYVNAGVMVVPRSHRELLLPPDKPMPVNHCSEQDHTNARLLDSGMKYRLLDRRANWQNWTDPGFLAAPHDAVLHFSGGGDMRRSRISDIRAFARPRIFGVGMAKTGTHSLAAMLGGAHQPHDELLLRVILGEASIDDAIHAKRRGPNVDVSNLNADILPALLEAFPDARFILTIREPLDWLRSDLNHDAAFGPAKSERWPRLMQQRQGGGTPRERLAYWDRHNARVLSLVPPERLLVVRTDQLDTDAERIAAFVGVDAVQPRRECVARYEADPLEGFSRMELEALRAELCPTWAVQTR